MRSVGRVRSHLLIPDLQVRADVDWSHLEAIGNYAVHAQPDVIVQIGDWPDMFSLSSYDKGKLSAEGRRLRDDFASVRASVELLMKPIHKHNKGRRNRYQPRLVITEGNHDARLHRFVDENPAFAGFFSDDPFGFKAAGFEVFPFLQIARIDNLEYTHYLPTASGNAITTAAGLLRVRHSSISVGHSHKIDIAYHATHHIGLISGAAYTHSESYAHGSDNFKRGIWRKSEVRNGTYDPMFVSIDYLKRRWL